MRETLQIDDERQVETLLMADGRPIFGAQVVYQKVRQRVKSSGGEPPGPSGRRWLMSRQPGAGKRVSREKPAILATTDWKQPLRSARPLAFAAAALVLAFAVLYHLEHYR